MPVSMMVTAELLTMRALRRNAIAVQVPCDSGIKQLVQLAIMAGRPQALKQPALERCCRF